MKLPGNNPLNYIKLLGLFLLLLMLNCQKGSATDNLTTNYILYDTINPQKHSPKKAWIFSSVLPGLGQAYNEKYWKIPVIYTGLGVLFYFANDMNNKYQSYKAGYLDYIKFENGDSSATSFYELDKINPDGSQVKDQITWYKDQYRRNRDLMIISMAGVYFLNIIDALVDAHFYDYDVSDDISLRIKPEINNSTIFTQSIGIKVRITF